ncbi:MAG: hypothetical protein DI536_18445 [Archangium gephyra]|uniref:Enamine deaminase RidA n=1 Tax=Archangium gephyra TaxID=48 RepID=A0A2W5UPY6_9BACT|nr:MAG: hypothetical protein DI536_18445 [Archangium gephyra]
MHLTFPKSEALHGSDVYSHVAVIPPGATLVVVGGQNAVDTSGKLVGEGDVVAQARQVLINLEAALKAGGCSWSDVFRVTVWIAEGADLRAAYGVFAPTFGASKTPPVVSVAVVRGLARPGVLLEVGVEAAR